MGKMDKNILVIKKENLYTLYDKIKFSNDYKSLYISKKNGAFFSKRGPAETDESLVQIIPYVYIINPDKTHIIIYTRTTSGGEERLHNKISLGVGGHIDEETCAYLPTDPEQKNLDSSQSAVDLYAEAYREIVEETRISKSDIINTSFLDMIYMENPEVCKYHIGLLIEAQVPLNLMKHALSLKNDGEIKAEIISFEDLYSLYQKSSTDDSIQIEDWSLYACKYILKKYFEEEEI